MRSAPQKKTNRSYRTIRGQGMTEYIIIVALIAIASVAAVGVFGDSIQASFVSLSSQLTGATAEDAGAMVQDSVTAAQDKAKAATNLQNYQN